MRTLPFRLTLRWYGIQNNVRLVGLASHPVGKEHIPLQHITMEHYLLGEVIG